MFEGKPLLPKNYIKHEFKIYLLILFVSRFIIPFIFPFYRINLISNFTVWLNSIYKFQLEYGIFSIWTPYPFFLNFLIFYLNYITLGNLLVFSTVFFLIISISDFINGILIWKILERSYKRYNHIMRWLYVYSPLPIVWIISQLVFELFIIMLTLLSFYFIYLKREKLSAFILSIGTSLKIFPAVIFISYLFKNNSKIFLIYFLLFLFLFNFYFFINPFYYLAGISWQLARPSWASIFGLIELINEGPYNPNSALFKDMFENKLSIFRVIGITPNPKIFVLNPKSFIFDLNLSLIKEISLTLTIFSVFIFLYLCKKRNISIEKIILGSYCLLFTFLFGFSPQYALYPFIFLFIALEPKNLTKIVILFQIILLLEFPFSILIFPILFNFSIQLSLLFFWLMVILRSVLFIYIPISILRFKL